MSQNSSKMTDIYIPELLELDSYWQKAVEDAIRDTLKGEKRLYHALKNRKKINEKLSKLGHRARHSQLNVSARIRRRKWPTARGQWSPCKTEWGSSVGSRNREVPPQNVADPSKSQSGSYPETPSEKKHQSPDRPLLGDGSLEKMKKSQNSFNCEPMGMSKNARDPENFSESEEDDEAQEEDEPEEEDEEEGSYGVEMKGNTLEEPRDEDEKLVEWLHVREGSAFRDSETDGSDLDLSKTALKKFEFQGNTTLQDKNYFINNKSNFRNSLVMQGRARQNENQKIPAMLDPKEDIFWENEVKNAIRENTGLERRLHLALAKHEILNENLQSLRMIDSDDNIQIEEAEAKFVERKRQSKRLLSPFIKFYLEVYRELCHKRPLKEIADEAAKRWWGMSVLQKSNYSVKNRRK